MAKEKDPDFGFRMAATVVIAMAFLGALAGVLIGCSRSGNLTLSWKVYDPEKGEVLFEVPGDYTYRRDLGGLPSMHRIEFYDGRKLYLSIPYKPGLVITKDPEVLRSSQGTRERFLVPDQSEQSYVVYSGPHFSVKGVKKDKEGRDVPQFFEIFTPSMEEALRIGKQMGFEITDIERFQTTWPTIVLPTRSGS